MFDGRSVVGDLTSFSYRALQGKATQKFKGFVISTIVPTTKQSDKENYYPFNHRLGCTEAK
jgi:hypothetical protein